MSGDLVSVVVPTRDRPDLLALTLRSLLAQRGVDLEVVVADDGEGPATAAVVDRQGDTRIRRVVTGGGKGVSAARNTGVAAARGAWVAFCDDDDLWAPDKLGEQLAAAQAAGAAWVYAGEVTVDEGLRVRSGEPPPSAEAVLDRLSSHNSVPAGASNVVVRTDVLSRAGPFDPALRTSEDWDLWLRLARLGPLACVPRPLVALRMHAGMASREVAQVLADVAVVGRRHRVRVDWARHHRWAAWMCLEDGRRGAALAHYARALAAGDVASAGRAAVVLCAPRLVKRRKKAPDGPWVQEAQTWLEPLRAAADDVASRGGR